MDRPSNYESRHLTDRPKVIARIEIIAGIPIVIPEETEEKELLVNPHPNP